MSEPKLDLKNKTAAVIGCGGLGCNAAVHLAGMGIGSLLLFDFDTVSESNLNRQFLYTHGDIGKSKVFLAAEKLSEYAPRCSIKAFDKKIIKEEDLSFAKNADALFLAVDNNRTRELAEEFCRENNIPLVNGGINGFSGSAYLYVPGRTPCLSCAGLTENESKKIISVSSAAGVIGALQAEIGAKHLSGCDEEIAGVLHIYDNGEITKLKIKPQRGCGICGVN